MLIIFEAYIKNQQILINIFLLSDPNIINAPVYMTPAVFTKQELSWNKLYFERSKFYESRYRSEFADKIKKQKEDKVKPIKIPRQKKNSAQCVAVRDKFIPVEPYNSAWQALDSKHVSEESYSKLRELFEGRPIWSRGAISYKTGLNYAQLKLLLPLVAYVFTSGPWRLMWTRYGYDPRTDSEARQYQAMDFRVRASGNLNICFMRLFSITVKMHILSFS